MSRSLIIMIAVSVALVAGGIGVVLYTASQSSGMFRFVDEVQAERSKFAGQEIWMAGTLEPRTHKVRVTSEKREEHRFELSHRGKRIAVRFLGAFPPNAQPGQQLIVRGKLDPAGGFHALELRTKCPSKYKSEYEARK